jgi:hypothetical protein
MKISLAGVVACVLFPALVTSQPHPDSALTGFVTDADTGEPIPGVNVFLAGTALGNTTDGQGRFSVADVPQGVYDLVVSIPGFEREIRRVEVRPGGTKPLRITLREKLIEAGPVDIVGEQPSEWKERLEEFGKNFFGTTRNAAHCRIRNPEVLELSVDPASGRFEAASRTPLVVENHALGYRMEFLMRSFVLEERQFRVGGWTKFETMVSTDETQESEWKRERVRAYHGSLRHFLSALVQGRSAEEGFRVSLVRDITMSMVPSLVPEEELTDIIIRPGRLSFERELSFTGYLKVEYLHAFQEAGFEDYWGRIIGQKGGWSDRHQFSWLRLSMRPVVLTSDGMPFDSSVLETYGYWAFERVAEWLPLEYRP